VRNTDRYYGHARYLVLLFSTDEAGEARSALGSALKASLSSPVCTVC